VDANILIRAVLGRRVREVLEAHAESVSFFIPEVAYCEAEARERLEMRDQDDWPILAAALAIGCPIWTEDSDFFGCGVATWTSNRVQVFLREAGP